MSENSAAATQPVNDKKAESQTGDTSVHNSVSTDNDTSEETPVKKSRRSKGPSMKVDELAAAEAKKVCGDVDTSQGRQLRKREPPPKAEAKPKTPAARAKKEPVKKKEAKSKKSKESESSDKEEESKDDVEKTEVENSNEEDETHADTNAKPPTDSSAAAPAADTAAAPAAAVTAAADTPAAATDADKDTSAAAAAAETQ